MNFSVLPPEVNSARMFVGAGPGPMLSAAAAWDGLAAELQAAATSFSSVTSELAGAAWQGPASAAMAAAAAPYMGWLTAAAAQAGVAAMAGYHGCASAVAARLTPFQRMPQSLPGQVSASAPAGPDIALSMFGTTLFQSGTAHATSGFGGVAFAVGANSNATANTTMLTPGWGSFATATARCVRQPCWATTAMPPGASAGSAAPPSSPATTLELLPGSAIATSATSPPSPVTTARLSPGPAAATSAVTFGNDNTVRAGGNPAVAGGATSNLNLGFAQGNNSSVMAGTLTNISSNANVAGVFLGTGCSAQAGFGNFNAAGVSGLLPGTNNLTANALGSLKSTFKFLPPALDFFGP